MISNKLLIRFKKSELIRVTSLTFLSTVIKMISGFISIKVIAIIIGPSGIALIGQLNNFVSIILTTASGGINNGVTKYISEYKQDKNKIKRIIQTSFQITILFTFITALPLIIAPSFFSFLIFKNLEFQYIFSILGLTILLYSLNNLILSVINGFKEFKIFTYISMITSFVGLVFSVALVFIWQLKGALISSVTFQSVVLIFTIIFTRKYYWLKISYLKGKIDRIITLKLLQYSLMTIVTATVSPVAQLFIRGFITKNIGINNAGIWEGMNRISSMYLMMITTSLSIYYLPRLSEINDKKELKAEIYRAYKYITPLLIIGIFLVFSLRNIIVEVVFSKEFKEMTSLFIYQLIGDFFKIMSWFLSYQMIAKAMTKIFIASELFFGLLNITISFIAIQKWGIKGASIGYAINYFFYLLFILFFFKKLFHKNYHD